MSKKVHVVGIDGDGDLYHTVYADLETYKAACDGAALTDDGRGRAIRLWDEDTDGELPRDECDDLDVEACEEEGLSVEFHDETLQYKHYLIKGDNIKVVDHT